MKKLIFIVLGTCIILGCVVSCEDYDSPYYKDTAEVTSFKGTVLDYLSAGDPTYNLHFDSMMVLINGIPGLRDTLAQDSAEFTIFAVPNECFQSAINALNQYRKNNSKDSLICCLKDFLIEPFTVVDTLIVPEVTDEEGTIVTPADTTLVKTKYDYRGQMDSLICRYIFRGKYDSELISENTNGLVIPDIKYGYNMNVAYEQLPATGLLDAGIRRFIFSDMNGSTLETNWTSTYTYYKQALDLQSDNGIIHLVTPGHEFGFDHFVSFFQNYGYE